MNCTPLISSISYCLTNGVQFTNGITPLFINHTKPAKTHSEP